MFSLRTVQWSDGKVVMVDQTKLPHEMTFVEYDEVDEVADAIRRLVVRGAPAIGVAAAFGLALVATQSEAETTPDLLEELERAGDFLKATRPTAVNLAWAVERILSRARQFEGDTEQLKELVLEEAQAIQRQDLDINKRIVENGSPLIQDGDVVMTHCNAGVLATAGYGTAEGVILQAHREGKKLKAFSTHTAPLLQGARITMFELMQEGVDAYLIPDTAVGHTVKQQGVSKVFVGADRILSDGTTYNKIGTYQIAVLANRHDIPFYVVAPTSTIDMRSTREEVVIEERSPSEVTKMGEVEIAPKEAKAYNPAFDETPPELITAIITEKGIIEPPFDVNIKKIMQVTEPEEN